MVIHYFYEFEKIAFDDAIGKVGSNQHIEAETNGRHFADDIFKCIFLNENVWIPIKISLKFVPKGPINNIPALFQIMARSRPGDKPLSEPMAVSLTMHICVTRPQWVDEKIAAPWAGSHLHIDTSGDVLRDFKSPATSLYVQQLLQASNEENIKAMHYWPFVREIHPEGQ